MIEVDVLLSKGATYKNLLPGEIIFLEGTASLFYYQLVTGMICCSNVYENGKEFIQSIVEPGESFGELSVFDNEPYAVTATASKASTVIRLNKSAFIEILKENPDLHLAFTVMLSKRIRFKFLILRSLANKDPRETITTLLKYLYSEKKNICPVCDQLKLTRQQIADMTGLRVETVIRVMRDMHKNGILKIVKGKVFRNMT